MWKGSLKLVCLLWGCTSIFVSRISYSFCQLKRFYTSGKILLLLFLLPISHFNIQKLKINEYVWPGLALSFVTEYQVLVKGNLTYLGRDKRIWYLSPMRAANVRASLRIRAVSPEPSLLAHTSSESRGTFRQKARSLTLSMAGHAQLKFVITQCSKTQIRLTGLICQW